MNISEATALTRTVKALCPSQKIDEYTAEAWEMALYDISAADAAEAVKRLARREQDPDEARYIESGHIRGEVRRIRDERIAKHPAVEPPEDVRTPEEFLAWHRAARARIAAGETITQPALEARPLPDLAALAKGIDS